MVINHVSKSWDDPPRMAGWPCKNWAGGSFPATKSRVLTPATSYVYDEWIAVYQTNPLVCQPGGELLVSFQGAVSCIIYVKICHLPRRFFWGLRHVYSYVKTVYRMNDTVDGWNPKQPPGMYETLYIVGKATYQLVQDFSHQQYGLYCVVLDTQIILQ